MKIKTKDLIGPALDWAVASIEKLPGDLLLLVNGEPVIRRSVLGHTDHLRCEFSTNWAQGGPIIEREVMEVKPFKYRNIWIAYIEKPYVFGDGPTPLIAAMRAFVASRMGNTVEVPEGLQ